MKLYKIIHARRNNAGDVEEQYTRLVISHTLEHAVRVAAMMFLPEELSGYSRYSGYRHPFKPFYEELYELNRYGGTQVLTMGTALAQGKKQKIVTKPKLDDDGKVIGYYPHIEEKK